MLFFPTLHQPVVHQQSQVFASSRLLLYGWSVLMSYVFLQSINVIHGINEVDRDWERILHTIDNIE